MKYPNGINSAVKEQLGKDQPLQYMFVIFTGKAAMLKTVTEREYDKHVGAKMVIAVIEWK